MELLEALLVHSERFDNVSASAALWISLVDFSGDPVVRRHFIVNSIDHVGEVGEAKLIALLTAHGVTVLGLEFVVMSLRERRKRGSTIGTNQTVRSWARAEARRDTVDLDIVQFDRPEKFVQDWVPLDVTAKAILVPASKKNLRFFIRVVR